MARKRTATVRQEPAIIKPDKVKVTSRKHGDRYQSDIVVNGRYVGMLTMSGSEYEMFAGCLLGNDNVEMRVVEHA